MPLEGTMRAPVMIDTTNWKNRANISVPGVKLLSEIPADYDSDESIELTDDEVFETRHERALVHEHRKGMAHLVNDSHEVGLAVSDNFLKISILLHDV